MPFLDALSWLYLAGWLLPCVYVFFMHAWAGDWDSAVTEPLFGLLAFWLWPLLVLLLAIEGVRKGWEWARR